MERKILTTADGSNTIAIPEMKVSYHSKHGAIQESTHVFLDAGLQYCTQTLGKTSLNILEMGFGTGLNCLLTAIQARDKQYQIQYHTLEAFPLEPNEIASLNLGTVLNEEHLFLAIHKASWEIPQMIQPSFKLIKYQHGLATFELAVGIDCIYYDAFAPSAQPELWTTQIFEKLYSFLAPGGLLVTYCSKSVVRHAMKAAGFRVTKIPGPYGKREMVRAFKDA